jgi:YcxB-like protein
VRSSGDQMNDNAITFEATCSDDVAYAAAKTLVGRHLRRFVGWKLVIASIINAGAFAVAIALGVRGWVAIVMGLLIGASIIYWPFAYLFRPRKVARRVRNQYRSPVIVTADSARLQLTAQNRSVTLPWDDFREIAEYSGYFLLMRSASLGIVLPKQNMPPAAQELVRNAALAVGRRK